jgi:hypothetical protein
MCASFCASVFDAPMFVKAPPGTVDNSTCTFKQFWYGLGSNFKCNTQSGVVAWTPAGLLDTQLANDLDIHDAAQIQRFPPPQV